MCFVCQGSSGTDTTPEAPILALGKYSTRKALPTGRDEGQTTRLLYLGSEEGRYGLAQQQEGIDLGIDP